MKNLIKLLVLVSLSACVAPPTTTDKPPANVPSQAVDAMAPLLDLDAPQAYSEALAASLVQKTWSVAARYNADSTQAQLYNRIFELGGFDQLGGFDIELSYDSAHLNGILTLCLWDDGAPDAQTVQKLNSPDGAYGEHVVVATYDGSTATMYLDGVMVATQAAAYTLPSGDMGVGQASVGTHQLDGSVEYVRYWDRVLTADEIAAQN